MCTDVVWVKGNLTYVGPECTQEDDHHYRLTVHELPHELRCSPLIASLLLSSESLPRTNLLHYPDSQEQCSERLQKWLECIISYKTIGEHGVEAQEPWSNHRQGQQTSEQQRFVSDVDTGLQEEHLRTEKVSGHAGIGWAWGAVWVDPPAHSVDIPRFPC